VALTHLVDTSVIKRLAEASIRSAVEALAARGELGRPTICDLEVGYSARNGDEWRRLNQALEVFVLVETTADHVRRALQVQRLLAERSQRGRKIPDLLVAAAAEEQGLIVLHYDTDFDTISKVTRQPVQWVAPAGSVD
jgi:predicted nucleic acid-binding protein